MSTIMSFNGEQQSISNIAWKLYEEYIGACNSHLTPHGESAGDYLQRLHMLQESIRRTMREEYTGYLAGRVTAERVSVTKGHAVLLGRIIASYGGNTDV